MNSKRIFWVMIGVVSLCGLFGIGGLVLGNTLFQKQSKQLIELKLEDQLIREQQTALLKANKDIEKYDELGKIARAIVPQDKDQAKAVREITKIAAESGIGIQSVTFPTSTLGQAAAKPATTEAGSTPAPTTPTSPITQVKPVDGIPGVYSMEIVVHPDSSFISFGQFLNFLTKLESNRRTAQITRIDIHPDQATDKLTFDITLNVYIKP